MNIQWYPGHMTKAKRMMKEDIKLVDVVIELVDARIPLSSRNPDMNEIAKNKPRIIVFNKVDLADDVKTREWMEKYKEEFDAVLYINSQTGKGINGVLNSVNEVCKEKIERNKKRGLINKPMRAMVVGIPNVGKSTFINKLVGKASAKTGNKPGVTRGKQWIKLKNGIELLDTPGILWPRFEDKEVGVRLALIGSIKAELLDTTGLAYILIDYLKENYKEKLLKNYDVEDIDNKDAIKILEEITMKRNVVKTGNEPDIERMSNMLLEQYRNGKLGTITLE